MPCHTKCPAKGQSGDNSCCCCDGRDSSISSMEREDPPMKDISGRILKATAGMRCCWRSGTDFALCWKENNCYKQDRRRYPGNIFSNYHSERFQSGSQIVLHFSKCTGNNCPGIVSATAFMRSPVMELCWVGGREISLR